MLARPKLSAAPSLPTQHCSTPPAGAPTGPFADSSLLAPLLLRCGQLEPGRQLLIPLPLLHIPAVGRPGMPRGFGTKAAKHTARCGTASPPPPAANRRASGLLPEAPPLPAVKHGLAQLVLKSRAPPAVLRSNNNTWCCPPCRRTQSEQGRPSRRPSGTAQAGVGPRRTSLNTPLSPSCPSSCLCCEIVDCALGPDHALPGLKKGWNW